MHEVRVTKYTRISFFYLSFGKIQVLDILLQTLAEIEVIKNDIDGS